MQWLVDKIACNKETLLSLRLSCVVFLFQVVWRVHEQVGREAAADIVFQSEMFVSFKGQIGKISSLVSQIMNRAGHSSCNHYSWFNL